MARGVLGVFYEMIEAVSADQVRETIGRCTEPRHRRQL
jgi:hypothetical protein